MINNAQSPYNQISPKAFSNQGTIGNMFGQQIPGTFDKSLGPVQPAVAINPLNGQQIDPTMDQSASMPLPPPTDVQTPIAPVYDINNY